jgi:hypothetical protein
MRHLFLQEEEVEEVVVAECRLESGGEATLFHQAIEDMAEEEVVVEHGELSHRLLVAMTEISDSRCFTNLTVVRSGSRGYIAVTSGAFFVDLVPH